MAARPKRGWLAAALAVGALTWIAAGTGGAPLAEQEPTLDRGRFLYRVYCMNCHGESGRGDGPTADLLKVAPADLTRLSAGGDGGFPLDDVYRVIDGRTEIRGHGSGRMPIWGLTFQEWDRDTSQEDEVRGRIMQLIAYLEKIQIAED